MILKFRGVLLSWIKSLALVFGLLAALSCATIAYPQENPSTIAPTNAIQTDCAVCPELVLIPAGTFVMGSVAGKSTERPAHQASVKSFYIGRMEITQAQWKAVMGSTPSANTSCGDTCPVESVSWDDVQQYLKKLSALTGKVYRLPSETEWEYSARAGSKTLYFWGDEASHEYANYGSEECCDGLAHGRDQWVNTAPVGSFAPNAFGLFDMLGNVGEWTADVYHTSYAFAPYDGSAWIAGEGWEKLARVVRGGAWMHDASGVRSAARGKTITVETSEGIGFRVARAL